MTILHGKDKKIVIFIMQVFLESGIFRDGINKVLNVVGKKNIRPILNQALVIAEKDNIEISATDSEISAKVKIPANVKNPRLFLC